MGRPPCFYGFMDAIEKLVGMMTEIRNYSKHNLNEIVVRYIKDKILSGELKRGDKLKETDIARDMNISRAPLREALRELNVTGLVTFSPRKGNSILDLTLKEVKEVFEIRISLELQILNIIITKRLLSEADFERLLKLTGDMRNAGNKGLENREALFLLNSLDIAFHEYLWRLSGSTRRAQYLESLFYQLLIIMNENTVSLGTFSDKAAEHKRIADALRSGDFRKTACEFTGHLRQYMAATLPKADIEDLYIQS